VAVTFGYVIIKIKRTKFHFEIAVNMVSLEQHSTLDSNLLTRFLINKMCNIPFCSKFSPLSPLLMNLLVFVMSGMHDIST